MTIEQLIKKLYEWLKEKTTGIVTIHLHDGGIRKVRIEKDVK